MKTYSISILFLFTILGLQAQDQTQALRFSNYQPFGTARYAALGSSTGAMGGDFSATISNPAGLAFFRKSEFIFSPSMYQVATTSEFYGNTLKTSKMRFVPSSIGFVTSGGGNNDKGVMKWSFGMGYSTLMDFNREGSITGYNPYSSLLDNFTMYANTEDDLSPFYEGLAFDANLMPYDESTETYWHDMQYDGYGQKVTRLTRQSGYIGEYSFSGAFNFGHFLYIGATFGIHSVRFNEDIFHTEFDEDDHVLDFKEFTFREFNSTRGVGYTGRLGVILRPIHMLRIGATLHLPTWYRLTDEKLTLMDSYFDQISEVPNASVSSPNGIYDYQLQTPLRASVNASLILFRAATISAGYEYVDYATASLSAYDYNFIEENMEISQNLRATHNLTAGAEFRLGTLYLRGGAQYLMNPYENSLDNSYNMVYTTGLGVKSKGFSFDIAYTYGKQEQLYSLYDYPGSDGLIYDEIVENTMLQHRLIVTLGFRF